MDFRDKEEDAQFRSTLRQWLVETVPQMGSAPDKLESRVEWWRPWQKRLHTAGYSGLSWPKEFGGQSKGAIQQAIFYEECDLADAPERLDVIATGFAGPTIIEYGTSEQKKRFLDPILSGDELWCQLFSEPGAGSDLAALKAKAVRDEEAGGWRIYGQKVWTSGAQISDFAILLARTSDAPKHKGISYFILPMRQEGVTVKPLKQMLGYAGFNEVFLDGAFVPDNLLVGELNKGWRVAMSTLGYERATIATGRVNTLRLIKDLISLVNDTRGRNGRPLSQDPKVRSIVSGFYSRVILQRLTGKRILAGLEKGSPGPEASTAKLFSTPLVEEICDYALSILGMEGQLESFDQPTSQTKWLRLAYQARGTSIAGGTTFIQRNILAERVLGLPRG